MQTDRTSAGQEGTRHQLREMFWLGPVVRLGGAAGSEPARRTGDPGSNPGPGGGFSLNNLGSTRCLFRNPIYHMIKVDTSLSSSNLSLSHVYFL